VPPRLRRPLAALLLAAALLCAGYLLWLRDSGLVAVERVRIVGVTRSDDAARVRAALDRAARGMTTLHMREDALVRAAADASPAVAAVRVETDFPHGLTITVSQHRPVALVGPPGRPALPVAANGTVLPRMPLPGGLPRFDGAAPPDGRVASPHTRAAVAIAGAAPAPLLARVGEVSDRPGKGLVVSLEGGPELIFGDIRNARGKWVAAARVLAAPQAEGAAYIDVRLPARPTAGGFAPGEDTVQPGEAEAEAEADAGGAPAPGAGPAPAPPPATAAPGPPQRPPTAANPASVPE
jgi:cell division protein FtsQ